MSDTIKRTMATIFRKIRVFITAITVTILFAPLLQCSSPQEAPPMESCDNLVANLDAAMTAHANDPSNRTKCIAVKEAGTALLNCPGLSPSDKEDYKVIVDSIFCN